MGFDPLHEMVLFYIETTCLALPATATHSSFIIKLYELSSVPPLQFWHVRGGKHDIWKGLHKKVRKEGWSSESRQDQEEGGELDSHEESDNHLRVQARSRRGRWNWTLKTTQERLTAGRWNWAQKVGQPFVSAVPQQLLCGHYPHDSTCTAVKTTISTVHKLLHTGKVSTFLTSLFWGWLMVSLVFTGWSTWTSYSLVPPPPHSPSLISLVASVDIKQHVYLGWS